MKINKGEVKMKSSKIIVTFAIFLLLFSVTTLAAENFEINYENQYEFNYDIHNEGINVENQELFDYLVEQSKTCNEVIDVSAYQIPEIEAKAVITKFFLNEEVYYISSAATESYENGYLKEIRVSYLYSQEEIASYEEQLNTISQKFISEIRPEWCDKEKVLYTDMFLCRNVEYGSENEYASHTVVGTLINGKATSDGYAKTFNYLFKKIGGNSNLVTSSNSAWNMAQIAGEYYHVDCYSNEISGYGKTSYKFLIRSDAYMSNFGLEWVADEVSMPAEEYDADWQYTEVYLQYKDDGYWYYNFNDLMTIEIDRYSFVDEEATYGDPIEGILEENLVWGPGLTYDGENFYTTTNKDIYIVNFDFDTYEYSFEKYFTLEDPNKVMYSIEYRDGKMYYDTTELDGNGFSSIDTKVSNVYVKLLEITSDETEITIQIDEIYELNLIKNPVDATEKIVWESLNPDIVEVDSNGNIRGIEAGNAVVTATCNDLQVVYNVIVEGAIIPPPPEYDITTLNYEDIETYKVIIFNAKTTIDSVVTTEKFPVLNDSTYSITILDEDGNEKSNWSEYIGSRNTIIVYQDGNVQAEFTAVVPGDVTGDGILRMYDAFQILKEVITGTSMDCLDNIIRDHSTSGDRIVRMYDAFQYLKEAIMS